MIEEFKNGALIDTRTDTEKSLDYKFEEIAQIPEPVIWKEKTSSELRRFPIFNQDSSSSCVAQTEAKEMGIMRWILDGNYVHFSAGHIYQRRNNKPQFGMGAEDARQIAQQGATLEVLVPSQNMNDIQLDNLKIEDYKNEIGKVFSVPNYIGLPQKDIELVASVIQKTGKGVMVWFYFNLDEWISTPVVLYPNLSLQTAQGLHSVTAVDFTLVNGKKCLVIEDSWGTSYGMAGQRIITEDFYNARNWFAGYLMNFKFDEVDTRPKYTFTVPLTYGMEGNMGVKNLQDILRYEEFYPTNIASTGNYYAITAQSLLKWQIKHNVASLVELNALQGKRVGPATIKALNLIYTI